VTRSAASPFDPQAANLMFMLVARRDERASLIVMSNKPFSAWGEIFGDEVIATAMIDRLVHHAEILSLKGESYRIKDRDRDRPPAAESAQTRLPNTHAPSAEGRRTPLRAPSRARRDHQGPAGADA
jgi:hypothetical protein